MSAVTTLKKDEQDFGRDEAAGRGKSKKEGDASDDEDAEAELMERMRNARGDPAMRMLHKLGFGDGDEEPSEVA